MKKYKPQKMISQSRFRDYFKTWNSDEQDLLLRKMQQLLSENSDYADDKNYGHLCNLITSLAMVMVLEENGKARSEAEKAVADAMYKFIEPQIKSMEKLASHSWFVDFLKFSMPIKFRNTLGYGWSVDFPEAPKGVFSMVTHKCIYAQIFEKYGMPKMTAVFCKVDDILYSNLPCAEFLYTQQIGNGGAVCDYTFKKKFGKNKADIH